MKNLILIVILLVSFSNLASGQATKNENNNHQPELIVKAEDNSTEKSGDEKNSTLIEKIKLQEEIKSIKNQNQIIESYHESVLTTSYFALGTAITLTVLLLGYNWWSVTRTYENDKKIIYENITNSIELAETRISTKEQEQRLNLETLINNKIEQAGTTSSNQFNQLKNEISEFQKSSREVSTEIKSQLSLFIREFRMVEEMVWSQKGIHSNSLYATAQALRLCSDDENDDFYDLLAKRFKIKATELKSSAQKIGIRIKQDIENILGPLVEKRPDKTNELIKLLNEIDLESD